MTISAADRLIVALDVPTRDQAMRLVDRLEATVRFFKVGWELFMGGEWKPLLDDLKEQQVFVDLKVPGDIENTIARVVDVCVEQEVRLLTLSNSVTQQSVRAAKARTRDGYPKLLAVPLLSSLNAEDLRETNGEPVDLNGFLLRKAKMLTEAGCDGLIASGDAIQLFRNAFGRDLLIVSPGVRPTGSSLDGHKRAATPGEAIRMGSDYLVVGRPIANAGNPVLVARQIIDEIEAACADLSP